MIPTDDFSNCDLVEARPTEALIGDLVLDAALQTRIRLDERTVSRYAKVLREGGQLPPISVAIVDGKPYVFDGFHRVEAHLAVGRILIRICARDGTMADAEMWAGCSNHLHGLPLSGKAVARARQLALGGYIRGRRHHKGRRAVKSLEEIARELTFDGCAISKSAVRRGLQKNHHDVYRKYFATGLDEYHRGGQHPIRVDPLWSARTALADFNTRANALGLQDRLSLLPELEAVLSDLKVPPERTAANLEQRAREAFEDGEF